MNRVDRRTPCLTTKTRHCTSIFAVRIELRRAKRAFTCRHDPWPVTRRCRHDCRDNPHFRYGVEGLRTACGKGRPPSTNLLSFFILFQILDEGRGGRVIGDAVHSWSVGCCPCLVSEGASFVQAMLSRGVQIVIMLSGLPSCSELRKGQVARY